MALLCGALGQWRALPAAPLTRASSPLLSSRPSSQFSNKMDVPGACSPVECMSALELDRIQEKPWHITASNALNGAGVDDGIEWLAEHVTKSSYK